MEELNQIIKCPLFQGINENDFNLLINSIHFQIKKYNKDEIVATAGDKVTSLFIILNGSVKGEMIDYSGKTIKIEDIEAPKPIAPAFLFGKQNKFPVTVTANNDVKILAIPIQEFLKILQQNTILLTNYLNNISTRTQFLSQKINFLSFKTIKEKIAHFLLQKAGEKFHSIELQNTQKQLADLFGVARPSLARILSEMQNEGLIKIENKTVTLLDKVSLNRLLQSG